MYVGFIPLRQLHQLLFSSAVSLQRSRVVGFATLPIPLSSFSVGAEEEEARHCSKMVEEAVDLLEAEEERRPQEGVVVELQDLAGVVVCP